MKLGSLFDGIGGFPLAATIHGITPVWASEIEKFPIEVTKTWFPDMKHLGDITQINGAEIEPVDIITAGSPCQDLSVAGKREGLSGARSGLFMEFIRIVREMRNATSNQHPRFIVWENVPGAFSSNKGQDFRAVLEEITETEIPMPKSGRWARAGMVRGNGRSVAWRVLDAQYWGVPQRRKRIFLVADFAGQRAGEILFECEGLSRDIAESGKARQEVAAGAGNGAQGASWLVRMREGCAGGGKGPLISVDKSLTLGCSNDQTLIAGTVSAKWAKGSGGPAGDECQNLVAFAVRTANTGANGHGIAEDRAHTLDQAQGQAVAQLYENHGQDSRLNGPLEVAPTVAQKFGTGGDNTPLMSGFRMVALGEYADDDTSSTMKAIDYKGATDLVAAVDCRNLYENKELSGTLQSKPNGGRPLNYQNPIKQGYAVRRLTPTECERLQGFPDGWTDIEGASDTGRYKALGNSVAIPCVAWIMGRIKSVLAEMRGLNE